MRSQTTKEFVARDAPESGGFRRSPAHAIVSGLRKPRDETQLTGVISAIAGTDATFAAGFATALLEQVRIDCPTAGAQIAATLAAVPEQITCASERSLYDERGSRLGRVDLIFESEEDETFVLVVENKLYSGFGHEQLARYQAGLRFVRGSGARRGGLVALTRDVPTSGELARDEEEWLGSVRWARLLPRLRRLRAEDDGVNRQWQLLLDVLDEQGDLGMTKIDADAVRAWSKYDAGRLQLRWLLEQIFAETLEHTRCELGTAHRRRASSESLAALWYAGRARKTLIQQSQAEVQFAISVPASYTEQTLRIGLWFEDPGVIRCGVTVAPRDADRALGQADRSFLRQLQALTSSGFEQAGKNALWFSSHDANEVLDADDAPAALLKLVKQDLTAIARSKILGFDISTDPPRSRRRKKSEVWG